MEPLKVYGINITALFTTMAPLNQILQGIVRGSDHELSMEKNDRPSGDHSKFRIIRVYYQWLGESHFEVESKLPEILFSILLNDKSIENGTSKLANESILYLKIVNQEKFKLFSKTVVIGNKFYVSLLCE